MDRQSLKPTLTKPLLHLIHLDPRTPGVTQASTTHQEEDAHRFLYSSDTTLYYSPSSSSKSGVANRPVFAGNATSSCFLPLRVEFGGLEFWDKMQQNNHAGVLSQTLASSPCITQILPARVRDVHHNDVVMVGHSSIQLREFRSNGSLSNVIARLELGTQILSANVISADAHEDEGVHPVLHYGVAKIHFSINGEPYDPTQPPQIVVLATALSELVFAYAKNLSNGTSQFVYARRFVLHIRNWPRKYGRHLAVDSK